MMNIVCGHDLKFYQNSVIGHDLKFYQNSVVIFCVIFVP
jgi:hypothetical protein